VKVARVLSWSEDLLPWTFQVVMFLLIFWQIVVNLGGDFIEQVHVVSFWQLPYCKDYSYWEQVMIWYSRLYSSHLKINIIVDFNIAMICIIASKQRKYLYSCRVNLVRTIQLNKQITYKARKLLQKNEDSIVININSRITL
jgi:hypothetical protein